MNRRADAGSPATDHSPITVVISRAEALDGHQGLDENGCARKSIGRSPLDGDAVAQSTGVPVNQADLVSRFRSTNTGDLSTRLHRACRRWKLLPLVTAIAARDIIAVRYWRNLKVVGVVAVYACANLGYRAAVMPGWEVETAMRTGLAVLIGRRQSCVN